MRRFLVMLIFAAQTWLGTEALASTCTISTLSSYLSLGSAGCTIGNLTFSDFGLLQQPTNSVPFNDVSVTPVTSGPTLVGLDFGVSARASSGMLFEDLVSYRISGVAVNGASLFFSGSKSDPDGSGAVTVVENLCIGGLFTGGDGVSGCNGSVQNLIVANSFDFADPPIALMFSSVLSLSVVTDIAIDGGLGGFAELGSASNRFQVVGSNVVPVPEPAEYLLLIAGLLGIYASRRTSFPRPSKHA